MLLRTLNDSSTLDDDLGHSRLVIELGDQIADCTPPFAVGVHGPWGSGKTSFLRKLQYYLTGESGTFSIARCSLEPRSDTERFPVIWFEAWRYQHEASPIVALLHEIREQLPMVAKSLNTAKKLGTVTVRSALLALEDLTKKVGISASAIQSSGEKYESANYMTTLPTAVIRQQLEHSIAQLLGTPRSKRPAKLIVIIDDMDRCHGEAALRLLEGIKIYLDLPNVVFVLGMNQEVVSKALSEAAKNQGTSPESEGRFYLEKVCPYVINLPPAIRPSEMMRNALERQNPDPTQPHPFSAAIDRLVYVLGRYEPPQGVVPVLTPNPRRIKAFANVIGLLLARGRAFVLTVEEAQSLIIFAYLYQFAPSLYRILRSRPDFYSELRSWALGERDDAPWAAGLVSVGAAGVTAESQESPTPGTPSASGLFSADPNKFSYEFHDPVMDALFRLQPLLLDLTQIDDDTLNRFAERNDAGHVN